MGILDKIFGKKVDDKPITKAEIIAIEAAVEPFNSESLKVNAVMGSLDDIGTDFFALMQKGMTLTRAAKAKNPDKKVIRDLTRQHNGLKRKTITHLGQLKSAVEGVEKDKPKLGKQIRNLVRPVFVKMGRMVSYPQDQLDAF